MLTLTAPLNIVLTKAFLKIYAEPTNLDAYMHNLWTQTLGWGGPGEGGYEQARRS